MKRSLAGMWEFGSKQVDLSVGEASEESVHVQSAHGNNLYIGGFKHMKRARVLAMVLAWIVVLTITTVACQGVPGATGVPGEPGERGEQGIPGDKGEHGLQGSPGNNAIIGVERDDETLEVILGTEWQRVLDISVDAPEAGTILVLVEGEIISSAGDLFSFPVDIGITSDPEFGSIDISRRVGVTTQQVGETYPFSLSQVYRVTEAREYTYVLAARNEQGGFHRIGGPSITAVFVFPETE